MRITYRLTTHGDIEDEKLRKVCEFLGTPVLKYIISADFSLPEGREVYSIVELSKYELLYVRLTVKLEDIIEVGDAINEQPG